MKLKYTLGLLLLFIGCSTWKTTLVRNGDKNDAIRNAIHDYIKSNRHIKKDSTYLVSIRNIDDMVFRVDIAKGLEKLLVATEDGVNFSHRALPTSYIELDNKLFYWVDSTQKVTDDLIKMLVKYNRLDTMVINSYIPARLIDDSRDAVLYYFCKENLTRYRKVRTKNTKRNYNQPLIKCK